MAVVRFEKVVSALPGTLTPNTLYMVRVGDGFDVYVSDSTGAVAHALNSGGGGGAAETLGTITGQTLDLSSGNVFDYTPTENTTFVFSNPPASGSPFTFKLILNGAETADGYDLVNAAYDSVSFSVAGQDTGINGLRLKPDGTKMYVIGNSNSNIYQYTLTTPWIISSAAYDSVVLSTDGAESGLFFKPDGTRVYVTSFNPDGVYQYDLSDPWNLATASGGVLKGLSDDPTEIFFAPDGTKFFVLLDGSNSIKQYGMTTPWDVTTSSYDSLFLGVGSQDSAPNGLSLKPDGTKLYMTGGSSDSVYQYSLPNPWSLNGAVYDSVAFSVASQAGYPSGVEFNDDGTKMYIADLIGDVVYQYSAVASAPATFDYPASVKFSGGTPPASPGAGEIDTLEFMTVDGGTSYLARLTGDNYA